MKKHCDFYKMNVVHRKFKFSFIGEGTSEKAFKSLIT
jgi:hypothetical protein